MSGKSCPKREKIQCLRSKLKPPLTKQKLFLYFLTRNEMMKSTAVGFCDLTVVFGYARHVADASWKPNTRLLHNLPLPQYPSAASHISAASNASTMVPLSKALCTGSALSLPRSNLFFARRDPRKSRRNSQHHNDTIRHSEQAIKELLMFSEPKLLLEKKWSFTARLQDFIAE